MVRKTIRLPRFELFLLAALTLGLLWLYWTVLLNLFTQVSANEDYSFALFLPLVSCYIIYLKWPQLRHYTWQPSWLGIMVMALGFMLYASSELVAIVYLAPISFFVMLVGIILLFGGIPLARQLAFPLLLLFCMVPLPSFLIKELTLPLQLLSSCLAALFLQILAIPHIRQGNVIDLGVRQLQVVEACSGLRYILSLGALSAIFCYFFQRRLWKAAILVIAMVPLAILANALRLAGMAILPALQEGFWHSFSSWLIFVFSFGFLALFNWVLNYLWPPPGGRAGDAPAEVQGPPAISGIPRTRHLLAGLVLVFLAIPLTHRLANTPPVPLLQSFDKFPMELGPWQGQRKYLDQALAQAVGADDYLEAVFADGPQESVSLWIAFFESQSKKIEGRLHSPVVCLTGGGWKILESQVVDFSPGYPVRYLLIEQSGAREVVYYWYLQRGRWLASEYPTKLYMGWDGFVKRRNDGAIIRLITSATPTPEAARHRLSSFAEILKPLLPKFIPN